MSHVNPIPKNKTVVFDLETTGLFPWQGARVIEIGAVAVDGGKITDEFHRLINPEVPIPKSVQKIHGITGAMLEGQPGPRVVFSDFHRFIDRALLVAHNAKFDLSFLRSEMANLGLGITNKSLCTYQISRRRFPDLPNYRLETVAQRVLGARSMDMRRHRALDDARLAARVWLAMMKGH